MLVLQLLVYMHCHPICDVYRVAHETTKKISSASFLLEDLLLEISCLLSVIGEPISLSKARSVLSWNLCFITVAAWCNLHRYYIQCHMLYDLLRVNNKLLCLSWLWCIVWAVSNKYDTYFVKATYVARLSFY